MTSPAAAERWLIVDRAAPLPAAAASLFAALQRDCALDPATARQRLCGTGYALLTRGAKDRLAPLQARLTAAGLHAILLEPPLQIPAPRLLQNLAVTSDGIVLTADGHGVRVDCHSTIVASLADLSGASVERHLRRLMTRNAYQGDAGAPATATALLDSIIKGEPILDLYLLGAAGPAAAIRVLPGRFDPAGLGGRKTLSAGRNLLALLDGLRDCGATVVLRSDCGLALLPGCQLQRDDRAGNLKAFTRFAWLAAHLHPTGPVTAGAEPTPAAAATPGIAAPPALPAPPGDAATTGRPRFRPLAGPGLFVVLALIGLVLARHRPRLQHPSLLFPALCAGLALIAFACAFGAFLLKRRIENTPPSRIRSLATGMVEISGRALRRYAVVAPQSGLNCIWYRLRRYRCDHRNRWQLISERSSGPIPFAVADATGEILVDPAGADIRPGARQEGGDAAATLPIAANRAGAEKWVEEIIPEGVTVYVLGFADQRRERSPSLHERIGERLHRLKKSPELLQRFDADNDGRVSLDEWETARAVIAAEESRAHLQAAGERRPQSAALVIGAPPRRRLPFVIAQTRNEAELVAAQTRRILAWLVAGTILASLALYLVLPTLPA